MKYSFQVLFYFCVCLTIMSCKTEYEKIKASNDPQSIKLAADKLFDDEKFLNAQELYEMIIPYYRGKEAATDIFYKYAQTHYQLDEFLLANHYFSRFSETFLNSDYREEALYMAGMSLYELSPNEKLDQTYSDEAIDAFQLYINTFPNSKRVAKANSLIEEMRKKKEIKAFNEGQLYLELKQYEAAMVSFQNMIQEYPDSKLAEEARYKSIIAAFDLAKNSIYSKQKTRYENVLAKIAVYERRHKKSKFKKKITTIKNKTVTKLKSYV